MVVALKVKKEYGEQAKQFLRQKGWLDNSLLIGKTELRYLILPISGRFDPKILLKKFPGSKFEEKNLKPLPARAGDLKHLLQPLLKDEDVNELIKSYDTVGDIAILDIPQKLDRLAKSIAWSFKRSFPNIKVVARKMGKVGSGSEEYRLRKYEILTGEQRLETMHREAGAAMHVDLEKAYFSPRSSHERERVAGLVKKGENILVMFAGIGPYALAIANAQPNTHTTAIEINPEAVTLMEENIRINRLGFAITPILGDVTKILPKLNQKFDRIIMPYPERSWDFLDLAFRFVNKRATIHFYAFVREDSIADAEAKIKKIAEKEGRKVQVIKVLKAGSYAPKTWRYVFDIKLR
jgi:tRNA (guanine37-N1)-methyltransferase